MLEADLPARLFILRVLELIPIIRLALVLSFSTFSASSLHRRRRRRCRRETWLVSLLETDVDTDLAIRGGLKAVNDLSCTSHDRVYSRSNSHSLSFALTLLLHIVHEAREGLGAMQVLSQSSDLTILVFDRMLDAGTLCATDWRSRLVFEFPSCMLQLGSGDFVLADLHDAEQTPHAFEAEFFQFCVNLVSFIAATLETVAKCTQTAGPLTG